MVKELPDDVHVDGFLTPRVCSLTGVPPSTLDYWVASGLVAPSLHGSSGKRATRVWSLQDVVLVRAIRALRESGCSMQTLRQAKELIEDQWGEDLRQLVLCWSGEDLLVIERWGDVRSTIKHPGQSVLHLVAIPVDRWRDEAQAAIRSDINITKRQRSAAERAQRARTPYAELGGAAGHP